jgi:hypothetical protein
MTARDQMWRGLPDDGSGAVRVQPGVLKCACAQIPRCNFCWWLRRVHIRARVREREGNESQPAQAWICRCSASAAAGGGLGIQAASPREVGIAPG